MKILTIVGARPQFIKAAAVSRNLRLHPWIEEVIVHTGQHFDNNMSEVFFEEMQIPRPRYNLKINSLTHGAMTGRMMEAIESVYLDVKPDFTLVYGDTNSTLAGALTAKKLHGKVVHVEAGLRSFNIKMPEEINRVLTDRISDILCCPTEHAVKNLKNEGYDLLDCSIIQSGDVMEDAALFYAKLAEEKSNIIQKAGIDVNGYVLGTIHRAENTDDLERLKNIVRALNEIHQKIEVVIPLHPRTRKVLHDMDLNLNVNILEPVGYFDMIQLIRNARLILTDSGGLQKEAFFFNKYCITLRNETEWLELVEHGYNVLTGADETAITTAAYKYMDKQFEKNHNFYGGGKAAEVIVNTLLRYQ